MTKIPKGNRHHLTLSERNYIEQEVFRGSTFRSIASNIQKDPSTISKEIKAHFDFRYITVQYRNCRHYQTCKMKLLCERSNCRQVCWCCDYNLYARSCKDFDPFSCDNFTNLPMFVTAVQTNSH